MPQSHSTCGGGRQSRREPPFNQNKPNHSANGRYTGTQDLYVNGVLQLSLTNVSYLPDTVTPMYIGAGANESSPADNFDFSGGISQVALFDTALSQSQISSMYTAATAAPEPTSISLLVSAGALLFASRRRRGV